MAQLYFRYSTMNAGKSFEILKIANNYEEQNKKVLLFCHALDTRYGMGSITSRVGFSRPALIATRETDLYAAALAELPADCILMDEGQFLTREQVRKAFGVRSTASRSRPAR